MTRSPFRDVKAAPGERPKSLNRPEATTRYVILFTPRSGSSRLSDLLTATRYLGRPGEVFNPTFDPRIASKYGVHSMAEYVPALLRAHQSRGSVFGCEVTYAHIVLGFGLGSRFLDQVRPQTLIWQFREDIVAQAVSISRMVQTDVAHWDDGNANDHEKAEALFRYRPYMIRGAIARLRWMETRTERLIQKSGLPTLRLSYESSVRQSENALAQTVAAHLGVPAPDAVAHSDHKKLFGSKNRQFAETYRRENPRLMARLDRRRAGMIAALQTQPPA